MQINTDFWGTPDTWINPNNPAVLEAGVKFINWGDISQSSFRTTWYGGYLKGEYDIVNPPRPDVTPTAWGIGKNSALANPQYFFAGYDLNYSGGVYDNANPQAYTRNVRLESKILDFCPQNGEYGMYTSNPWLLRCYPNLTNNPDPNYARNNGILKFNYQNIIVVPCLEIARRVTPTSTLPYGIEKYAQSVTISEYFDGGTSRFPNPAKNDYPIILAVRVSSWYMGDQPTYDNGVYTGNPRTQLIANTYMSMRYNEALAGKEYYKRVRMLYNGQERVMTPTIQEDFYTLYPTVLWNSCISGYYYNTIGYQLNMVANTEATTDERAWAISAYLPIVQQNGNYNVEAIQQHYNDYYGAGLRIVATWENATKDEVMRDVAYLGFWFADDNVTAERALTGAGCVDEKMHIPVFDAKGVTTGEWKSGTAAAQEPNATWGDPFEDSPYIPSNGGDDDDFGNLNNSIYRGVNFYNLKMYALTETQLLAFLSTVNAMYTGDNDTLQMDLDFKGSNPNDYIIGLYGYPFDIPNLTSLVTINLGPVDTGVQCRSVADNFYGELSFGSMYIAPYYNDFRDYEPYTSIELYVPLCGTVKLDPALYIGHTINLYYVFDPSTGNLSAKICRDNIVDKILDGAICVQIPITSANMGDYQRSIHQIKTQILKTAIDAGRSMLPSSSFIMSAMSENVGGMVSSAPKNPISVGIDVGLKAGEIRYELTHTQPHISTTGTADPLNALNMDNHAFVFIKRAKMLQGYDADIYSHTVGNACLIQSKIGDMSGFIKCSNVDLSGIPATADEINAIQTALQNGIYV